MMMDRDGIMRLAAQAGTEAAPPLEWGWDDDFRTHVWKRHHDGWSAPEGTCPDCGDDLGSVKYDGLYRYRYHCECELRAYREAAVSYFETHKGEAVPREWDDSEVPARYAGARFANFTRRAGAEAARKRCARWAEAFERSETNAGLFLCGPFGSGKTHLLAATAFLALERTLVRPRFTSAAGLIASVKGGSGVDMSPVRHACAAELLILDDLGQVGRTEFDREIMYSIVSDRYDHCRPTLISSNLAPDRLGDLLGGALASRIHEACEVVVLTASDYRRQAGSTRWPGAFGWHTSDGG